MEQPIKTVIFDFDGTLADTARGILRCALEALHAFGFDETDNERLRGFIGPPLLDSFMCYSHDEEIARGMVSKYREHYRGGGIFECDLYDGVTDMLSALSAAGVQMAIASSKPGEFVRKILAHLGIDGFFSFVSAPVIGQPEPSKAQLIEAVIENLNADKATTLMVGDRMFDIDGAAQAGVMSAGVLYGFGSETELKQHKAQFLCESPNQITELILG